MENTKAQSTTSPGKFKHITDADRQVIEKLYRKGLLVAQIASLLNFHHSTIYREIQRGRVTHLNSELVEFVTYSADKASDDARMQATNYGPSLKIANDTSLVHFLMLLSFVKFENDKFPDMGGEIHSPVFLLFFAAFMIAGLTSYSLF